MIGGASGKVASMAAGAPTLRLRRSDARPDRRRSPSLHVHMAFLDLLRYLLLSHHRHIRMRQFAQAVRR